MLASTTADAEVDGQALARGGVVILEGRILLESGATRFFKEVPGRAILECGRHQLGGHGTAAASATVLAGIRRRAVADDRRARPGRGYDGRLLLRADDGAE